MKILISNTSDTPLYQQIKDQIKDAVLKEELVEQKMLDMIKTAKSLKISREDLTEYMENRGKGRLA